MTGPARDRPRRDPWARTVPLALLVALVALTVGVVREGRVYRLDDAVLSLTPGETGGPALPHALAYLVVDLATPAAGVGVVLLVVTWLASRWRDPAPLVVAVAAIVLLTTTVLVGKAVIDRAAPGYDAVGVHDGSYPSGHTATALVCAGVLADLVSRVRPHRRRAAWAVAACWTLLVVLGLLWLHFHWLSDVAGSVLLGSLVLWLLLRWPWRLGERIARH